MKAEEFDQKFDAGEDMTTYLDMNTIRRPGYEQRRQISPVHLPQRFQKPLHRLLQRRGIHP